MEMFVFPSMDRENTLRDVILYAPAIPFGQFFPSRPQTGRTHQEPFRRIAIMNTVRRASVDTPAHVIPHQDHRRSRAAGALRMLCRVKERTPWL
ncbi:hypothetical protein [Azospirillum picis]|uniref:Uncharacterized protein n=1 Tax=Azospirillum picis TaxID=488438 RepID=A0ABU0MLH0_9PROT|nr:hypothetical protein [Azospirillum picis]MBP2301065.1 hypothetical protein [Azospirillum picis]MDQ0534315.1 hypothetical protein [Azospirillum picis]